MRPLFCAMLAVSLFGQTGVAPDRFEVASIKPSGPQSTRGSDGGPGSKDPRRYIYGKADLLSLILSAYNVKTFQVSSATPLDRDAFDLNAVAPEGATKPQLREMLQNLLADRFHMKSHMERRSFLTTVLTVSKNGFHVRELAGIEAERFPKLPLDRPGFTSTMSSFGFVIVVRMRAQKQPMSALAGMLNTPGNTPVLDATGLTGLYDFTLEYALGESVSADDATDLIPRLPEALQRQLGLQLAERQAPWDVLVVDSIDRLPTEN